MVLSQTSIHIINQIQILSENVLEELGKMLILTVCMVWVSFSIFNCWVIFSKPPKRKMITADINAIGFILEI